jgi:3,4-dihydroxy 2-butanone 4-phosphate synthase/GTP cyclohydrolase II
VSALAGITEALAQLRLGRPVLVVDDEHRENEGDVVLSAELADQRWVAWTVRHTSGLLCAPMPHALADQLELPPMLADNQDPRGTAYTVSVDARYGISTGISAADRARTARRLADPATGPNDLIRPGHVLPLRARPGGVLERAGHTEAAVDLCRLAGLAPVGLIAEAVNDDGTMMRLPQVLDLGAAHGLVTVSIADLALWRLVNDVPQDGSAAQPTATPEVDRRVHRVASTTLPTTYGRFTAHGYRDLRIGAEHLALVSGDPRGAGAVVRLHSECLTGDVLGSLRCDCGPQLQASLATVARVGGVVLYLRGHEGRGVGLLSKLEAYALQDLGRDTVDANLELGLPSDAREYGAAAAMLADLGLRQVRLLTNNPAKVEGLAAHGVQIVDRLPLVVMATQHSAAYLETKRKRMGHHLPPANTAHPVNRRPA